MLKVLTREPFIAMQLLNGIDCRINLKFKKNTTKNTFKHEIKKHLFNSARVKF